MTYSTPIPNPSGYGQYANQAKLAYDSALARISQRRGDLMRQYGYEADFGPNGAMSNLRVSGNNPAGRYQQMMQSQGDEMGHAQYAEYGRGLSGGVANADLSRVRDAENVQKQELGQSLLGNISGLVDEQRQSGVDYNNSLVDAEHQALQDAINSGNFNPGDYSNLPEVPYGDIPNIQEPPGPSPRGKPSGRAARPNPRARVVQHVIARAKAKKGRKR